MIRPVPPVSVQHSDLPPIEPKVQGGWHLGSRHGGLLLGLGIALAVGLLTRTALTFEAGADVTWNMSLVAAFAWGALFDLAAALWWTAPLAVLLAVLPRTFFRARWSRCLAHLGLIAVLFFLLFGAVGEWVFWDEFGVRFNFIAVDYLVYTKEVIGNIRESYPMPLIYAGLLTLSLGIYGGIRATGILNPRFGSAALPTAARWCRATAWVGLTLLLGLTVKETRLPAFANNYNRELAKNGLWSLFAAFRANELNYDQFYPTMPLDAAFKRMHEVVARDGSQPLGNDPRDLLRLVRHAGPERRLNVIQITVESLSADFLGRFGNQQQLTPNLDALMSRALVFDNFYATGTRTDRGMEALTLSVPPTPGRSLVKRPENENLFSLGAVFRSRGYETAFIYGGFGYFDNMNHFFGGNGYRVVDRTKVAKEDITFANVWGACDGDLFRWTMREADRDFAQGKPFFYFAMTTSNHRPFTFPDGQIDLPSKTSGRAGGVKYTDHAIGEFLRAAATKPWFKETVFVIVADHCASSAGKTELPVQNYHIPLIIYAPGGQVPSGAVTTLASQIDYGPTLLGLLGWTYPSRFYGWDVLAPAVASEGRALIGNYQKLGLYQSGGIGIVKPVRQSMALDYDARTHATQPRPGGGALVEDTMAYYETASWLFRNGRQKNLTAAEWAGYSPAKLAHASLPADGR